MSAPTEIIAKLEKLLRLAGNAGATQAEMESAMRKAQALAIEHNINLSTIDVEGNVKVGAMTMGHDVVHTRTEQERPYHVPVINTVSECFHVKAVYHSHYNSQSMRIFDKITFVGEVADVAMAVFCFGYLEALFPKCWLEYRKNFNVPNKYTIERSFYAGLQQGIIEANYVARQDLTGSDKDRYAIVLVDKAALVQQKLTELFPNSRVKNITNRGSHDGVAAYAGYVKGTTVKLKAAIK